jgi:serpin B
MTRLVLTNAIYFKAHWAYEFAKSATSDGLFHLLDGSTVTVPLMHQQHMFSYAEGDNYQAIQLPYLGNDVAMTILLPREGQFAAFENSLDSQELSKIVAQMTSKEVNVTLPKFSFESSFRLDQTLANMGMPDAFTAGTADFSGMTGNKELFIGAAIHKSFVAVDELGTEAAAVTAVAMAGAAMPSTPVDFDANRPFIFLIQDVATGSILFTGRVSNPAA